jgi:hypothetical protein
LDQRTHPALALDVGPCGSIFRANLNPGFAMVHFANPPAALRLRALALLPRGVRWFHEAGAWVERPRPATPSPTAANRITPARRHDRR